MHNVWKDRKHDARAKYMCAMSSRVDNIMSRTLYWDFESQSWQKINKKSNWKYKN